MKAITFIGGVVIGAVATMFVFLRPCEEMLRLIEVQRDTIDIQDEHIKALDELVYLMKEESANA